MDQRRLKRILVPGKMIVGALRGLPPAPFAGLPPDVEFEWANYDVCASAWWVFLSHPSWPEVPECQIIPEVGLGGHVDLPTWRDRSPML